jgi:hypothetical protein
MDAMGESETTKSMSRPMISGPNMYALLIREFDRVRPAECSRSCRVPLPFWGPAPGGQSVYWYMTPPPPCPYGCSRLIAELWAKLTTEYKVAPPEKEQILWKNGMRSPVSQG